MFVAPLQFGYFIGLVKLLVGRNWRDYVIINQNFRPEFEVLVSNPGLIMSLGWRPAVDIAGLAEMMIEK